MQPHTVHTFATQPKPDRCGKAGCLRPARCSCRFHTVRLDQEVCGKGDCEAGDAMNCYFHAKRSLLHLARFAARIITWTLRASTSVTEVFVCSLYV
jgi:hypothetical protein